jgi:hypothetical protein
MEGGSVLSGGGRSGIAVAFRAFVLPRGKRLEVEWKEKDGRRIRMRVGRKILLRAGMLRE